MMQRLLLLIGLSAAATSALHIKRTMGNLYKRHDAKGARDYHLLSGNVTELFIDNNINHFTTNGTMDTYRMRYLLDESNVNASDTYPPILFYCGNEGDVWTFYNNSGFMTQTLAQMFNAVVLFGEHRYYGESMPFGDQSFTKDNVKYLTLDQTFMDYTKLIMQIKNNTKYKLSPVIAFGGSYGGMLAAWFRMKYPHII